MGVGRDGLTKSNSQCVSWQDPRADRKVESGFVIDHDGEKSHSQPDDEMGDESDNCTETPTAMSIHYQRHEPHDNQGDSRCNEEIYELYELASS